MADFKPAFIRTMGFEGDWTFLDGGTYRGIVRAKWPNWAGWQLVDAYCRKIGRGLHWNEKIPDVHLDALVAQFYRSNFWIPVKGDDITPQLIAEFIFDWNVNSGEPAITHLQQLLHVDPDGSFGSATLQALNASNYLIVYIAYRQSRIDYYKNLVIAKPEKKAYLDGWLDRVDKFPTQYS